MLSRDMHNMLCANKLVADCGATMLLFLDLLFAY